jgi:hypothetical protein
MISNKDLEHYNKKLISFLQATNELPQDFNNTDLLIDVIKDRIDNDKLSCYTISHRSETLKHVDGEIVNLEKENKITRRV